ncbi:hypothetical protein ONZ45_g2166 [Pleurotus djamor]|nr:hypothetical protein ONZ45_g2166 [Pleurotus djamor]
MDVEESKNTVKGLFSRLQVSKDSSPYQNKDVLPLSPSRRTWTKKVFVFFWLATAINIAEWSAASTGLAIGITVGQSLAVHAVSTAIICMALVINGHGGGKWHIPFAVLNRTGWGIRGAWVPLTARIILSCCWYGVQSWFGGQMVKNMIGAIWPSFYTMKNTFGPGVAMQTNEFVSFIIFWIVQLPIFLLRPEQYRIPAIASSVIVTIAAFAIFIWALAKQGNVGPLWHNPEEVYGIGRLQGSALSWTIMRLITSGIGGWAGGILYQSGGFLISLSKRDESHGGIVGDKTSQDTPSTQEIRYGDRGFYPDEPLLWKLYDLLEAIQKHQGPGARAAVFFAAFAFFLSQLCVNTVAVGVVGGMDLAALLPQYLNIRRGSFIIAIIGICINPWKLLNTEYHIIRKRRVKLSHMYMPNFDSDYWFWHGVNWRAPIAWVLVGFFQYLDHDESPYRRNI